MAIFSIMHPGSGNGNQLCRYLAVRCLAANKGFDFGVINPEGFKGKSFMNLDMGVPFPGTFEVRNGGYCQPLNHNLKWFEETKVVNELGWDVRPYDWRFEAVQDGTICDGEFQSQTYIEDYIDDIQEWCHTEPLPMNPETCLINFRGGPDYIHNPEVFLPRSYWLNAISMMQTINPRMIFEVHTDDIPTARQFFPQHLKYVHDIGINWRAVRCAKFLILSNSSFAIIPALLNTNVQKIIAPKFWAGHNSGVWRMQQNQYPSFTYIM